MRHTGSNAKFLFLWVGRVFKLFYIFLNFVAFPDKMNGVPVQNERAGPGGWNGGFFWGLFAGGSLVFLAWLAARREGRGKLIVRLSWAGARVEVINRWWPE